MNYKLELYIKWLQKQDLCHFIIRGLSVEEQEKEKTRMYSEFYSKMTLMDVPKRLTIKHLKTLV